MPKLGQCYKYRRLLVIYVIVYLSLAAKARIGLNKSFNLILIGLGRIRF